MHAPPDQQGTRLKRRDDWIDQGKTPDAVNRDEHKDDTAKVAKKDQADRVDDFVNM